MCYSLIMTKHKSFFTLAIITSLVFNVQLFANENKFNLWGSGDVFKCTPVLDGVLFGTGAAIYGTDLILQKAMKFNQKEFDENLFDKNDVNAFDRFFMQPYSKPLDITADILLYTALASPAILFATQNNSEWMTIGMMYAETVLLAQGVKEISKLFINRARPYMYYEGFPEKDVYDDLDWNNSCPSGHSTMSFMSATFLSYVFCQYNPDSNWKYPVIIGSYAVAATTAILRVASGNHFPTDIILGAAIGTGIGFLVPWLHTLTANKNGNSSSGSSSRSAMYSAPMTVPAISTRDFQVGISPFGICCTLR